MPRSGDRPRADLRTGQCRTPAQPAWLFMRHRNCEPVITIGPGRVQPRWARDGNGHRPRNGPLRPDARASSACSGSWSRVWTALRSPA